jgi:hypothetical protein
MRKKSAKPCGNLVVKLGVILLFLWTRKMNNLDSF